MKTKKRLRPLMGIREIFTIPRILLIPAFLLACALVPLILLEGSLPAGNAVGAALAALVFGGLVFFDILLPAMRAGLLRRTGVDGTAVILAKEKRTRTVLTPDYSTSATSTHITIEFTPQEQATPLQLEAEVTKLGARLAEGKKVRIRYSAANPRVVKFEGE
jgi:hypothetical protein